MMMGSEDNFLSLGADFLDDEFLGIPLEPLSEFCESIESSDIDDILKEFEETGKSLDLNDALFDELIDFDFKCLAPRQMSLTKKKKKKKLAGISLLAKPVKSANVALMSKNKNYCSPNGLLKNNGLCRNNQNSIYKSGKKTGRVSNINCSNGNGDSNIIKLSSRDLNFGAGSSDRGISVLCGSSNQSYSIKGPKNSISNDVKSSGFVSVPSNIKVLSSSSIKNSTLKTMHHQPQLPHGLRGSGGEVIISSFSNGSKGYDEVVRFGNINTSHVKLSTSDLEIIADVIKNNSAATAYINTSNHIKLNCVNALQTIENDEDDVMICSEVYVKNEDNLPKDTISTTLSEPSSCDYGSEYIRICEDDLAFGTDSVIIDDCVTETFEDGAIIEDHMEHQSYPKSKDRDDGYMCPAQFASYFYKHHDYCFADSYACDTVVRICECHLDNDEDTNVDHSVANDENDENGTPVINGLRDGVEIINLDGFDYETIDIQCELVDIEDNTLKLR